MNNKVFSMPFTKVSPLLIAKTEKKGHTCAEVYEATTWLTGNTSEQPYGFLAVDMDHDTFRMARLS